MNAGGCTVIETDNAGNNYGEWVGISGTLTNCAGGPTPVGHLADLRGDRDQAGRPGRRGQRTYPGPRLRLRGLRRRHATSPSRSRPSAATPTRRWRSTRPQARLPLGGRQRPNGLFYRWTAPAGVRLAPGIADQLGDTDGTLAAMAILMDDGSVLPDVAYLTSAQLGRPFPVRWVEVPERDGQTHVGAQAVRRRTVTRGKKFEGVWGTDEGVYIVNSFAFNSADLPADAVKHDGMVWFYSYADETITLVTYFPHQTRPTTARPRGTTT